MAENEPPRLNSPSKGRTVRKLCVQPVTRAQQIKDEDLSASAVRRRGGKVAMEVHTGTAKMEVTPGHTNTEDEINLEVLMQLKTAFAHADRDGGGDLSVDEFVRAFLGILGKDMGEEGLRQMFMKIDANADGTVDWDEFSSFMLLQNQGKQNMQHHEAHAEYSDKPFDLAEAQRHEHKDMIERVVYVPHGDRWATNSRDGTIKLWSGKDLRHLRTLRCGSAWVTDMGVMPRQNKLVAATFSRNLRIYDLHSMDVVGGLADLEHTPLTLHSWAHARGASSTPRDHVVTGDNGGHMHLYRLMEREEEDKLATPPSEHWKLERLWRVTHHTDWVTKVKYLDEMGSLCSSSLDKTLALYDVERRSPVRTLVGHAKGIYSFDFSAGYKFIASCGMDRHIMLWNPFSAKSIGSLSGHSASIKEVLVVEQEHQLVSVGVDKVIKVWDIRTHKVLQTFTDKTQYRPENHFSATAFDATRRQLLTASTHLKPWPLRNRDVARSGSCHGSTVTAALYNPNFHQVVSGDHQSNVCVWEVDSGRMRFRFGGDQEKITAMTFDKTGRRLLTGSVSGVVKMWNFSNGGCLKTLMPSEASGGDEVTALEYVLGGFQNKNVLGVGWNRKVTFWEDAPEKKVVPAGRMLSGHADDILCISLQLPSTLATGSYDGVIIVWNIDSGAIKLKLQVPDSQSKILTERSVEKVLFLKTKPGVLLAAYADGHVRFWDAFMGEGIYLERHCGHEGGAGVIVMCTDPENQVLATGGADGRVKVWNISGFDGTRYADDDMRQDEAMLETAHWQAHAGVLTSIEYVPKGRMLVTAAQDCNVILWTVEGVRVGNFGRDTWVWDDQSTWASTCVQPIDEFAYVPTGGALGESEGVWASDILPDSDDEEEEARKAAGGESYEPEHDYGGATPMQMVSFRRFVKHERREAPLDQRVWLPTSAPLDRALNHPHTPGRPATSIAHLLHIHDLKVPTARPETSFGARSRGDGGGTDGAAAVGGGRRPHTQGGSRRARF